MHSTSQLIRIRGNQDPHGGDEPHEGYIEGTMMSGAIIAHKPSPVQGEDHITLRKGHVYDHLVQRPLHEGGIDGYHRLQPRCCQAGSHAHRLLLGDAHIDESLRKALVERPQTRSFLHGCSDGHDALIGLCLLDESASEDIRELRSGSRLGIRLSGCRIVGADAMETDGVRLGRSIACPFLGDCVDEHGAIHREHQLEHLLHLSDAVAVDRRCADDAQLLMIMESGRNMCFVESFMRRPSSTKALLTRPPCSILSWMKSRV